VNGLRGSVNNDICNLFSIKICSEARETHKCHTDSNFHYKQTKNSVTFSRQANYTVWATVTCRRNLVPTFADRGVTRGQRGRSPMVVNLSFLDWSRYFFFQVAPHLSSRGWVDPVTDVLLLRKSGSVGNRTRDLWVSSQEVWPLDHKGSPTFITWRLKWSEAAVPSWHIWVHLETTFACRRSPILLWMYNNVQNFPVWCTAHWKFWHIPFSFYELRCPIFIDQAQTTFTAAAG
jgi:hypothetical protein